MNIVGKRWLHLAVPNTKLDDSWLNMKWRTGRNDNSEPKHEKTGNVNVALLNSYTRLHSVC